jgi:polysaccharide biosynthesis/export protein
MTGIRRNCAFIASILAGSMLLPAQQQDRSPAGQNPIHSSYVLGPDDQLSIRALDAPEIADKPLRISTSGQISLPMVGRLRAAGLTVEELEKQLSDRLQVYVRDPQVAISVTEFRSQPVSVIGAVNQPGIHQLQGTKRLIEVLSLAGGLRNDAGNTVTITRRKEWGEIPLPNVKPDASGEFTIADVSVKSIMAAENPKANISIHPNDVITVPKADLVYVIGSVRRSGGFVLGERETISVLQALSLAEGLDRTSAPRNAKILRLSGNDNRDRSEIAVDVKKILEGKTGDVWMQANDVLFIPGSAAKSATLRGIEAAIQVGTGVAIWRR